MNAAEQSAYVALGEDGWKVTDPKYCREKHKAEEELKQRVRKCWKHKDHFPSWIADYIKTWTAHATPEKQGLGTQRPAGEGTPVGKVA